MWNANGTLSIVDRKKNIFKLAQGEYIAVEYIEGVYLQAPLVGQIWVYGNSFEMSLVAVVVPDPQEILPFLAKKGFPDVPKMGDEGWKEKYQEICAGTKVMELLMEDLELLGRKNSLKGFEKVKKIYVETDINGLAQGFSVENGCLTPTFKLKRPALLERYKEKIDGMYGKN